MHRRHGVIARLGFVLIIAVFTMDIFLSVCTFAAYSNTDTVKIGYYNYPGLFYTDSEGNYRGFYYEYYQKISQHTNWKYEFIEGTFSKCISMLKSGEVDIIAPVAKTTEQSRFLDYTDKSVLNYAVLYVSANSPISFDDYNSFNGLRVGMLKDTSLSEVFSKYQREHGFSIIPCIFDSEDEQTAALKAQKIDAILSFNLRKTENEKVVARVGTVRFYFAVSKGNSKIMAELNNALGLIEDNERYYDSSLHKNHFSFTENNHIAFTKEETDYINKHKKIKAVYEPDWKPFEYYDRTNNKFAGINAEIFELISSYCGIEFEFIKAQSGSESIEIIKSGAADIICGVVDNPSYSDYIIPTNPYFDAPYVVLGKKGAVIDGSTVIALPKKYAGLKGLSYEFEPNLTIDATYNTADECYKAVKKSNNVITVENSYIANYLLHTFDYYDLMVISLTGNRYLTQIGVSKNADPALVSVLNKAISRITDDDKSQILLSEHAKDTRRLSLKEFLKSKRQIDRRIPHLKISCYN